MCPYHDLGLTSVPQTTCLPQVTFKKKCDFSRILDSINEDFGIHLLALIIQIDEDSVKQMKINQG
jgi:hypothetical protein